MGKKISRVPVFDKKKTVSEQRYEIILSHILDPESSPLPDKHKEQFNRIIQAARLLDEYHPANVIPRLLAKYPITRNTAREDIRLAMELFKSKHEFDWDFWQSWQIKDLVDTIRTCKLEGRQKERIAAQKVLKDVIGVKPMGEEDPKRMEKNVFNIQLNNNQTTVSIQLDKLKGLSAEEIRTVVAAVSAPDMEDGEIVEILNT
jgi:hypothetical protein